MLRAVCCLACFALTCCGAPTVDLEGRPCDANDECLPGYTCDVGICVPSSARCELGRVETCGSCEQDCTEEVQNAAAVCRAAGQTYGCDYEGGCASGYQDADLDRTNGCECPETGTEVCDNVDNDCNGQIDDGVPSCQCTTLLPSSEICDGIDNDCNQDIDETFPCSGSDIRDCDSGGGPTSGSEACNDFACDWSGTCQEKDFDPPGQVAVTATAGNGSVDLNWTYPADMDLSQCVIRRQVNTAPTGHDDGDLVREFNGPTPGAAGSHTDVGVSNGTLYHYGVYCRDLSGNWQDLATTDSALPVAPAPANPTNLVAVGGDGRVDIAFTTPASTFSECILTRRVGGPPADHEDVDDTLGSYTAPGRAEAVQDTNVSNGVTYFYAVFCQTDGTWNDATVGGNVASATPRSPSDCLPGDTVSVAVMATPCAHYASGQSNALLMGLTVQTNCANTLTGLSVHRLPASTVTTELTNVRLFFDTDGSGSLTKGDAALGGASSAGAVVAFTGVSAMLPVSMPVGLLVVADVGTVGATAIFAAWEMRDDLDIELDDSDPAVSLPGAPLRSPTQTLNSGRCDGTGGTASDLGPGTFGSAGVEAITGPGNTSAWADGAGNESGWEQAGADLANATADCTMITAGSPNPVYISDASNASAFLHVDTGVPLGLPLCGLEMRVYGTSYDAALGTCTRDRLSSFTELRAHYYVGATTVTGETTLAVSTTTGPDVGANLCDSDFADFDLSALYAAASANGSAADPFDIRMVFDDGGGLHNDGGISATVPELFFRISP